MLLLEEFDQLGVALRSHLGFEEVELEQLDHFVVVGGLLVFKDVVDLLGDLRCTPKAEEVLK